MYTFIPGNRVYRLLRPSQNSLEIGSIPTSFQTFRMDANARRWFLVQQIEASADVTRPDFRQHVLLARGIRLHEMLDQAPNERCFQCGSRLRTA